MHGQPAHDLADLHGLAGHDDQHAEDHDARQLEHALVRQLALQRDRQHANGGDAKRPEESPLGHACRPGLQRERLEEQGRLEALAVDGAEAEHRQPDDLGRGDGQPGSLQDLLLAPVQPGHVVAPVDPVEEPVEDEQHHRDGNERDDRLELLAVADERRQHRLGDDEARDGRGQGGRRADQKRPSQAAPGADEPGRERGEDQDGLEALPEDDDGGVRHDGGGGGRPRPDGCLRVGEGGVEADARRDDLLDRGLAPDQLGEAGQPVCPVPEVPLRAGEEVGCEPAQPLLRPELEERVRLEPCLLRLAVFAGPHGADHTVERRRDHVEVGGAARVLPFLREDLLRDVERGPGLRLDRLLGRDGTTLGRGGELHAEAADELVDAGRGSGITLGEDTREVGERLCRAVPERDRLLDLERERDPAVCHSAPVLDRHEREETEELAGAPELLVGGERCSPETLECALDVPPSLGQRRRVGSQGGGEQELEARACLAGRRRTALGAV